MTVINLTAQTETIPLDPQSENWLRVAHRLGSKNRMCAVPSQYFDVLKTRGFLEGAPGNAKITASGNSYFLTAEEQEKAVKKTAKKKKKK